MRNLRVGTNEKKRRMTTVPGNTKLSGYLGNDIESTRDLDSDLDLEAWNICGERQPNAGSSCR